MSKPYSISVAVLLVLSTVCGCGNRQLAEQKSKVDRLVGDIAQLEKAMIQDKLIRKLNGYDSSKYRDKYMDLYKQVGEKGKEIEAVSYPRERLEKEYGHVLARMGLCYLVKNPDDVVTKHGLCVRCDYCNGGDKLFE